MFVKPLGEYVQNGIVLKHRDPVVGRRWRNGAESVREQVGGEGWTLGLQKLQANCYLKD